MQSILKKSAVAVALLAASAVTFAAPVTTSFGALSNTIVSASFDALDNVAFDNIYTFTVLTPGSVQGVFAGGDLVGDFNVKYKFGTGTVGAGSFSSFGLVPQDLNGAFSIAATASQLTPGTTYWIEIAGSASQASYALTLTPNLAPVPEPESWAMLLAGLGAMGAIARRRRATSV